MTPYLLTKYLLRVNIGYARQMDCSKKSSHLIQESVNLNYLKRLAFELTCLGCCLVLGRFCCLNQGRKSDIAPLFLNTTYSLAL